MAHRSDGPASSLRMFGHVHWAMCGGGGGWLARHGTSIRWASLLAWMFGHVHRAMCSGRCQFEVLEEHVRACVPAYKTRQMRQARKALEPEGVGGASEGVGGRRRALENVDEGRCCWPSALVQVPDQPWPSALIQVPDHPWPSALIPVPDQPCWEAPLSVLSMELGVLPVRETSRPPGV